MQRVPQLDGLRAIAILMVFAHHALHVPFLWTGVDLFFVLSGYLITGILLKAKPERNKRGYWRPFYKRRALRILPPYAGFLSVLLITFRVPWSHIWYWYAFFAANFALAFGKVTVDAMTPLWSLAVEEQFYFLWPWVVLWCSRKTLKRVAIGVLVLAPLVRALCTPLFKTHFPIYTLMPFRADTLACGAFIRISESEAEDWIRNKHRSSLFTLIGAAALLVALSSLPSFRTGANNVLFNSLGYSLSVFVFGGGLTYVLGLGTGIAYTVLTCRPMRYLGRISYTFYLYHVAVLSKVGAYTRSTFLIASLGFVIAGLIAALSWRFFESPILNAQREGLAAPMRQQPEGRA